MNNIDNSNFDISGLSLEPYFSLACLTKLLRFEKQIKGQVKNSVPA